jgi:hypothetical protein
MRRLIHIVYGQTLKRTHVVPSVYKEGSNRSISPTCVGDDGNRDIAIPQARQSLSFSLLL